MCEYTTHIRSALSLTTSAPKADTVVRKRKALVSAGADLPPCIPPLIAQNAPPMLDRTRHSFGAIVSAYAHTVGRDAADAVIKSLAEEMLKGQGKQRTEHWLYHVNRPAQAARRCCTVEGGLKPVFSCPASPAACMRERNIVGISQQDLTVADVWARPKVIAAKRPKLDH